jgi:hypothetical protein
VQRPTVFRAWCAIKGRETLTSFHTTSQVAKRIYFKILVVHAVFPPHYLKTETDPVSEMSRFIVFRIPDDGRSANNSVFVGIVGYP